MRCLYFFFFEFNLSLEVICGHRSDAQERPHDESLRMREKDVGRFRQYYVEVSILLALKFHRILSLVF